MELRDARIAGKTFMGVSVRVFQENISIWMGELSKAEGSLQRLWASSNPLRAQKEQKGRRRVSLLSLCSGIWFSSFLTQLGLITRPLIIWPSDSDWIIATSFPGSPAWRQRLSHNYCAPTIEAHVPRTSVSQQEKTPQWEARARQRRVAPACHN